MGRIISFSHPEIGDPPCYNYVGQDKKKILLGILEFSQKLLFAWVHSTRSRIEGLVSASSPKFSLAGICLVQGILYSLFIYRGQI